MISKEKISGSPPVVIFAGGKGTRLGGEESSIPKPLVRIGPHPVIMHIIASYVIEGFSQFIICTGYKSLEMKLYFDSLDLILGDPKFEITPGGINKKVQYTGFQDLCIGDKYFTVEVVYTGQDTLTAGRLSNVRDRIQTDIFLCTYGDGLTNQKIQTVVDFHIESRAIATLTAFHPPSRFGELTIGRDGFVTNFEEKPLSTSYVNGGFFVFSKEIFNHLDESMSLEEGLLTPLTQKGLLAAYESAARWQMMDTPREVSILNNLFSSGNMFWLKK